MVKVEVCIGCDSEQSVSEAVTAAFRGGAATVELCSAMHLDGLTPRFNDIAIARRAFQSRAGLMVMIRPRGGDFCYTTRELQQMGAQIETAARLGANGVVFGVLQQDKTVSIDALQMLLKISRQHNLTTTFHRAFDATPRPLETLALLKAQGVDRLLTSGTPWSSGRLAVEGLPLLEQLIDRANGQIEIVIGGGVNRQNAATILTHLNASQNPIAIHAYSGAQISGLTTIKSVSALVRAAQPD